MHTAHLDPPDVGTGNVLTFDVKPVGYNRIQDQGAMTVDCILKIIENCNGLNPRRRLQRIAGMMILGYSAMHRG